MGCQNCGQDNPSEGRFCVSCGTALAITVEQPILPVDYAGFWQRFGALLTDCILLVIFGLIFLFLGDVFLHLFLVFLVVYMVTCVFYFWLFTGLKGQTPGKTLFHIRVVSERGGVLGLKRAALRELLGRLLFVITVFAFFERLLIFGSSNGYAGRLIQFWHDKIAGTYVIKVRPKQ